MPERHSTPAVGKPLPHFGKVRSPHGPLSGPCGHSQRGLDSLHHAKSIAQFHQVFPRSTQEKPVWSRSLSAFMVKVVFCIPALRNVLPNNEAARSNPDCNVPSPVASSIHLS